MWLASLRRSLFGKSRNKQTKVGRQQRRRFVPCLDHLEERILPAPVGAGDTPGLITALSQATSGETIQLTNSTYTITQTNNTTNGANALPVISVSNLTIDGQGATIDAQALGRLFNVASGASLTLENITLLHGKASGANAQGGGIYDAGTSLTLKNVSIKDNSARASGQTSNGAGNDAQGGGIYANGGSLIITGGSIEHNLALGGVGGSATGTQTSAGAGGNAEGAGVYASNTTLVFNGGVGVTNTNSVRGGFGGMGGSAGQGGTGGSGLGGGVYAKGGSVTLSGNAYVNLNQAYGGIGGTGGGAAAGGAGGAAEGGGVYVLAAPLTLTSGSGTFNITAQSPGINTNSIFGGQGGKGGGTGGAGGVAQGGGVFASGTNSAVNLGSSSQAAAVNLNTAIGGQGGGAGTVGVGGDGGLVTGGGVAVVGDKLSLTNATLYGNSGTGGKAGNGVVSSKSFFVVSNFGTGGNVQGGGLFVSGSSSVTVLNSTFADESAYGGGGAGGQTAAANQKYGVGGTVQGGGLYATTSTVNVLNSTFADSLIAAGTGSAPSTAAANSRETAQGGGLYASGGSLTLTNDTIAWNGLVTYTNLGQIAGKGGGVYSAGATPLHVENTIIALNQLFANSLTGTTSGTPNDLYGTAASNDHDFIGDGSGSNLTNNDAGGDLVGTDAAPLNPNFVPSMTTTSFVNLGSISGQMPANYGGLTYTLALAGNSAALNAGDSSAATTISSAEGVSTATDQRGMARVIGGKIDIGATQSGLLLSGIAPATVQAGQTLTYTITLSNNGPTALSNVTLTDALPANTTFVSLTAPSGWTTTTPAVGGTGQVTASLSSLAANTTATFTLIVQVGPGAQGSTLTDNASVNYTGTANPVSSNLSLSTTVPGSSVSNITNEVGLFETPIVPNPFGGRGSYVQGALFINESGAPITGPIALVLKGLPAGVTVTNANGTLNGSPYINIEPPGGTWLPGVRYFLFALITFSDPSHVKIKYTPEVVQGI